MQRYPAICCTVFLCVIAFMFIWGIKYAGSTNVFFLMMSPAGLSDVSGCDV